MNVESEYDCSWPRRPEAFLSLPVFIYPANSLVKETDSAKFYRKGPKTIMTLNITLHLLVTYMQWNISKMSSEPFSEQLSM